MNLTESDIKRAIAPKSDQLNAIDFASGPAIVTITNATKGSAEQPVHIHLEEFPKRSYRPSTSMLRFIAKAWGLNTQAWVGQKLQLYLDPNVPFKGAKVGGIKISALTGIQKQFTMPILEARKSIAHTVKPLAADAPTAAPAISDQQIEDATSEADLKPLWDAATKAQQERIRQRVDELRAFEQAVGND